MFANNEKLALELYPGYVFPNSHFFSRSDLMTLLKAIKVFLYTRDKDYCVDTSKASKGQFILESESADNKFQIWIMKTVHDGLYLIEYARLKGCSIWSGKFHEPFKNHMSGYIDSNMTLQQYLSQPEETPTEALIEESLTLSRY